LGWNRILLSCVLRKVLSDHLSSSALCIPSEAFLVELRIIVYIHTYMYAWLSMCNLIHLIVVIWYSMYVQYVCMYMHTYLISSVGLCFVHISLCMISDGLSIVSTNTNSLPWAVKCKKVADRSTTIITIAFRYCTYSIVYIHSPCGFQT
jgi:hypothetical protein